MLFKEFGRSENDAGEWHEYGPDEDTGKTVSFRLREIPDHVDAAIRKRMFIQRDGSMEVDMVKERKIAAARCAYALLDSRNFEGQASDQEGADTYSHLLGLPVSIGVPFGLDARWNGDLKEHVLSRQAWLRTWILEKMNERGKARREIEVDAAKNS
jgi:hypothetical protein